MLYIFDLGNVVIDIDFKRVLGVWSNLSGVPLASLSERFVMGHAFEQHERGEIDDEAFASELCQEMGIALSFEQFAAGWESIFIGVRPEVLDIMQQLRRDGQRVVVLSNTNRLHHQQWSSLYPEIEQAADHMYLSQELGMRKPEAGIYEYVLQQEGYRAQDAIFFDDNADNITAASALGIHAIQVNDRQVLTDFFSSQSATASE